MRMFKIAVIAAALAISAFCLGVGTYNQNYAHHQLATKHRPV
jgi:hypothetical protein